MGEQGREGLRGAGSGGGGADLESAAFGDFEPPIGGGGLGVGVVVAAAAAVPPAIPDVGVDVA